MKQFKQNNYILTGLYTLNIILLIIISIGFLKTSAFFKTYFFLSFSVVPALLLILSIANQYYYIENKNNDISLENKKWYIYIPYISNIFIILIFSLKIAFQLERIVLVEVLTLGFVFTLTQLMMLFIQKNKEYKYRKSLFNYLLATGLYAFFIALMMVLTFDYSIII